jgi:hypothetical protein
LPEETVGYDIESQGNFGGGAQSGDYPIWLWDCDRRPLLPRRARDEAVGEHAAGKPGGDVTEIYVVAAVLVCAALVLLLIAMRS